MRNDADSPEKTPPSSRAALWVRLAIAAVLAAAAALAMLRIEPSQGVPAAIGAKRRPHTQTVASVDRASLFARTVQPSDDALSQLVVGTWQDDFQGQRTLTVRPDGTATMLVVFDGWKARLFTPRLQIETTWTIDEGRFNRQTIGGEPADKVQFVKERVGDRASDKIVKLSADRMVLLDQDGQTRYDWRRVR
jgi:hypothetical protein